MKRFMMSVALIGLVCADLKAQDAAVEIIIARNKAGDTTRISKTLTTDLDGVANIDGKETKKSEKAIVNLIYIETLIDKPDPKKRETKATRAFETAEVIKDGVTTKMSYEKKTMMIEKKEGDYAFTVDGKPIPKIDAENFKKEYEDENSVELLDGLLLPGKAVKVGEEWKVDMAKYAEKKGKEFPYTFDIEKTKAAVKLTNVYMKDGHRYGMIDFTAEIVVKTMMYGKIQKPVREGSKLTTKMQYDICIDGSMLYGSVKSTEMMDMSVDIPSGGTKTLRLKVKMIWKAEKVK